MLGKETLPLYEDKVKTNLKNLGNMISHEAFCRNSSINTCKNYKHFTLFRCLLILCLVKTITGVSSLI